jgi:hypothetical protein
MSRTKPRYDNPIARFAAKAFELEAIRTDPAVAVSNQMNESPLARQNATRQSSLNHLLHRTLPERNKIGARHEGIRRGKIGMVEMSTVVFARQIRGPRQLSTTGGLCADA